jgi:hypothetical protein
MNKKDSELIAEAYENIYNEGVWDRIKGTAAQIGGNIKGTGQAIKGGLQQVKAAGQYLQGNDAAAKATRDLGRQNVQAGKNLGQNAKIDSLLKSKTQAINGLANDIINDFTKMGLNNAVTPAPGVKGRTPKTAAQLAAGMLKYVTDELNSRRPV